MIYVPGNQTKKQPYILPVLGKYNLTKNQWTSVEKEKVNWFLIFKLTSVTMKD